MPSLRTRLSRAFAALMSEEAGEALAAAVPRAQPAGGCFILEISKAANKLMNEPVQPDWLVKEYIGLDQNTKSVFQASDDIEEVEALTALLAGRNEKSGPENRHAIRLLERDFVGLPITYNHTPQFGTTGIHAVDRRHFDLESDTAGYTQLMTRVAERVCAGEHRVRVAGKHQVALMLRAFSSLDDGQITPERRRNCSRLLKQYKFL